MDINIKNTGYQQEIPVQSNNTSNSSVTKSQDFVPVGKSQKADEAKELYKKLGLTKEQFEKLCEEYPGFEALKETQQLEIINTKLAVNETSKAENSNEIAQNSVKSQNNSEETVENQTVSADAADETFSPKNYSRLPNKEKMNLYAMELAKNRFIPAASAV